MEEAKRTALLAQFATYLDQLPDTPVEEPPVDLHSLFIELAALKNEVRLESRQVKGAVEGFKELLGLVEEQNRRLERELSACQDDRHSDAEQVQRPLLLTLIDLRDRLEEGLALIHQHRPHGLAARFKACAGRELALLDGLAQGQAITLRRLDQQLAEYGIEPIQAKGQQVDPHTMRVVAVEHEPTRAAGEVLKELRKGFLREGRLLRGAEVIANRENETQ